MLGAYESHPDLPFGIVAPHRGSRLLPRQLRRHYSVVERAAIVDAYWRRHQLSTSLDRTAREDTIADDWAVDMVDRLVAEGDQTVVELLCSLADSAPDDYALARLGAGPIENLLDSHASLFGDAIDAAARTNLNFRTALRCALFDNHIAPEIATRLRRFGAPL